jgi:hypothetical protein
MPSPLFRKEINIATQVRKARAYVSGIGYSEFYINGNKISDHVLDPGQTNYEIHTFYVVHDITSDLKEGKNVLGFWLVHGFYGQNLAFNPAFEYGKPRLRAKLFVEYTDGSSEIFTPNTTAVLYIPYQSGKELTKGEHYGLQNKLIPIVESGDKWLQCEVGFGVYHFEYN